MGGTQRIDFFKKLFTELKHFSMWLIEIEPFFPTWLIEIEPVFPTWLIEIEPFFSTWLWLIWVWVKELNFLHDSKNWTFFRMTQRFCWKRLKESNFFFEYDPKNRTSFYRKYVLRIVFQYDSHNWTYFSALLKEWNIWVWLKELNFLWYDSHNWTLKNSKNWFSQLQELNFFWKTWLKEFFTLFLILRNALNFFLGDDSKNWTLLTRLKDLRIFFTWLKDFNFLNMTQWIEPLFYMTQRIEPFLGIWLNGLNPLHERTQRIGHQKIIWLQQRNLFVYDLGNWAFFFLVDSKNWTFSQKYYSKIIDLFWHDSQNWTPFQNMTHRIELFFWRIGLIEIEPFFSTWVKENDSIFSMSKRIFTKNFDSKNNDPFFGNVDPKNWLLWTKIWL